MSPVIDDHHDGTRFTPVSPPEAKPHTRRGNYPRDICGKPLLSRLLPTLAVALLLSAPGATPASTTVIAWGDNRYGQTNVPASLTNAVSVAGGGLSSLALRANGKVAAWGDNLHGQTSVPAGLTGVVAVASGVWHNLALRSNGTVVAWGENRNGQTNVPAGLNNVVAVAAGGLHNLALRADTTVVAWGWNSYGQTNVPAGLSNIVAVAGGWAHSLALRANGTVAAWGWNDYGQTTVPPDLSNVVAVAAGYQHSLALRSDGSVTAWGSPGSAQTQVPADLTNAVAIAAGNQHSLALRSDGSVSVWGSDGFGQTQVPADLNNVVAVAACGDHNLALSGEFAPFFTQPALSRTNATGTTTTFSLAATGTAPLTYQWRKGGANLADGGSVSGTSTATLTLANVQVADAAGYAVVVSNAFGSVTSAVATLTVVTSADSPLALAAALDGSNLVWSTSGDGHWFFQTNTTHDGVDATRSGAITDGQSSVLQTTVTGPGVLTFWWRVSSESGYDFLRCVSNGVPVAAISGEVNWQPQAFFLGAGVQTLQWTYDKDSSFLNGQDAGWLDQVSFTAGSTAPFISTHPLNAAVLAGSNATFTVTALGDTPLAYQWRNGSQKLTDGGSVSGATTSTLTLIHVQPGDAGDYSVIVSNAAGSVTSAVANLTVLLPPTVTIAAPTTAPTYTSSLAALNLAGVAAAGSASLTQVTWSNNRGGAGTAVGTTNWTVNSIALQPGLNVLTVTALDASNHTGIDTLNATLVCSYSLDPATAEVSDQAGGGLFTVNAGVGCGWTALANAAWLHTATTGHGGGRVAYTVDSNPSSAPRSGTIAVADQLFTVNQSGAQIPPVVTITTPTTNATYTADINALDLAGGATDGLGIALVTWSSDRGGSGTATGTTNWFVRAIPLPTGTNVITVTARNAAGNAGTATLAVSVEPVTLNPTSATAIVPGGSGALSVAASSACHWSASSTNTWLHTTSSGLGSGSVTYWVDPNADPAARTGAILVGTRSYTVTQDGWAVGTWQTVAPYGSLYNNGNGWFGNATFGWLWFTPDWVWGYSSELIGWLGRIGDSPALWSPQFRWLTPSTTESFKADTTAIGPIHITQYNHVAITDGWVVSDRFGYLWAAGDGEWFYSDQYGWLGVTPDGGIWCVNQGKFL